MSFIILICVSTVSAADNDTIYVNNNTGNDSWDGLNATYDPITGHGPKLSIKNATGTVNNEGIINIANGTYAGENNTRITINKNMAIIGESQSGTIIDGEYFDRIFTINSGVTLILQNLTLTNVKVIDNGAIFNIGNLIVENCTFTGNYAYYGGAISNWGGTCTCTVNDCTFIDNHANSGGGAIYNWDSTCNVTNCTFTNNTAYSGGGAINNDGTCNVTNCTFTGNTANIGGAIYSNIGICNVTDCTFTSNVAVCDGGAIFNRYILNIENCIFNGNTVTNVDHGGGAICNYFGATLTVLDSNFTNNAAPFNSCGGAIFSGGPCTVTRCNFTSNSAGGYGGAINNMGGGLIVTDSNFTGNIVTFYSGGAINNQDGDLTISGNNFTSNTATGYFGYGGAIFIWYGSDKTMNINSNNFINNTANKGSAININHAYPQIHFNRFLNNTGNYNICSDIAGVDATNNWWGTNFQGTNPFDAGRVNENVIADPWILLRITASPTTIDPLEHSTITADLTHNSADETITGNLPNGMNVLFACDSLGTVNPESSPIVTTVPTTFTAGPTHGESKINATVDNQTVSTQLTVNQIPTSIMVYPVHSFAGQDVTLTADVKDRYGNPLDDGQVIFTVNGVNAGSVDVNGGSASLIWTIPPNWSIGNYNLLAVFNGTGTNYANSTNTSTLTVDKTPTNITVSNASDFWHQYVNIVANLTDYYGNPLKDKTVYFQVAGDSNIYSAVTNSEGLAILNYQIIQNVGNYVINTTFTGDPGYLLSASNPNGTLTVNQTPTNITVENAHNFAGQNTTLTANVKDYYNQPVNNGNVIFTINGITVVKSVVNGVASLNWTIPNWNVGIYDINAIFDGTGTNYDNSFDSSTLTVDKTPTNLIVSNATNFWHQYVDITANLTDTYGNPLNGKTVSFTVAGDSNIYSAVTGLNGLATLYYQITQNVGNYIINTTFTGDNSYLSSEYNPNGTLTVNQTPTNITVENAHNFAGQNVILTANVKDYYNQPVNNGNVIFTINGVTIVKSVVVGTASINWTIPNWNVGNYIITAIFNGTGTNNANSTNTSILTVNQTPTNITVEAVHNFAGQNVNLTAHVTDYYNQPVNGGQVRFMVGSATPVTANVVNGLATLNWQIPLNWIVNNYQILADFNGTGTNYVNSTNSSVLTVDKTPTNLIVNNASDFWHQYVAITANLTDYYGNPINSQTISFTVAGDPNTYTAITVNGLATLNYHIIQNIGNYNIRSTFAGNENYLSATTNPNGTLTVTKTPTNITIDNTTGNKGKTIILNSTLTDYYGTPLNNRTVEFYVDNVKIGENSTNNGIATFNYNITQIGGSYNITAKFLGDSGYLASTGNGTLKVNQSSVYVNITASKTNPTVGETITLTFKLGNNGPDPADDVVFTYVIPEGMEFVSIETEPGYPQATYNATTRTITWPLGTVPIQDPWIKLNVLVLNSGTFNINPTVTTSTYDPTLGNDMQHITINAVQTANAASTVTSTGTIGMQETGIPITGLILAILAVFGSLIIPKRK